MNATGVASLGGGGGGGGQRCFGCTGFLRPELCAGFGGEGRGLMGRHPLGTALHTINISIQHSFCESHTWRLVSRKNLRQLNSCWALPVYPIFEDEKSNGSEEKSVKRKIGQARAIKRNRNKFNQHNLGEKSLINGHVWVKFVVLLSIDYSLAIICLALNINVHLWKWFRIFS